MEVHHHSHHPKKWKEYFLEFLMLFLAVTLGFLAENFRESYVEHERENELAKSLYNEMKADSIDLDFAINFRITKENYLNFLYENYEGDSDNDSIQKMYQVAQLIGVTSTSRTLFEPRNAIIHQLENSGMLRYFKDETIQSDIHNIINSADKMKTRLEGENEIYQKFVLPITLKYRNMDMVRKFSYDDSLGNNFFSTVENYVKSPVFYKFPKMVYSGDDLKELKRIFEYYRFLLSSTRKGMFMSYKTTNSKLLKDLREYYKLK